MSFEMEYRGGLTVMLYEKSATLWELPRPDAPAQEMSKFGADILLASDWVVGRRVHGGKMPEVLSTAQDPGRLGEGN